MVMHRWFNSTFVNVSWCLSPGWSLMHVLGIAMYERSTYFSIFTFICFYFYGICTLAYFNALLFWESLWSKTNCNFFLFGIVSRKWCISDFINPSYWFFDILQYMLVKFAGMCGATVCKFWKPNVTHVVATTDVKGACTRTMKVLMAILSGKWILTMDCKHCFLFI